jgi:hypothetical protein
LTSGTSMCGGASVKGVLSLISAPLEYITHTCDEGCRKGGDP